MPKLSVSKFWMPILWIAAIAVAAIAIVEGAGKFSAYRTRGGRVTNSANRPQAPALSAEQRGRVRASLDAIPLGFEANQGQTDPQVKYTARGSGYSVFLTPEKTVFALNSARPSSAHSPHIGPANLREGAARKIQTAAIDMRLVGGNSNPQISAGSLLPGTINYYRGSNPANWQTGVKQYASVAYRDVYPGVNMVFHGEQRQLEFDFVVAPGTDPKTIGMGFKGAKKLSTDGSGNLILTSSAGNVVLHKPVAYQEKYGNREIVEAAFQVKSGDEVGLNLGAYDRARELVIDPALSYATYLGGSGEDEIFGIAVDGSGNAYVAGQMASPNFPTQSGTVSSSGSFDAFVTKVSASGTTLDFTTVLAGTGTDAALGIAAAKDGSAVFVVGNTGSTNFPSTLTIGPGGGQDAFVAKLDATSGTATAGYITRIGGTAIESGNGIAVDSSGNAYIGGETESTDFPTTGLYTSNAGAPDGFVAKINGAGSALLFSTYLGGSNADLVTSIAVDTANPANMYVGGITASSDLPATSGVLQPTAKGGGDAFVSEIKANGSGIAYLTYLGGTGQDSVVGIAVDAAGEAYVTGDTTSTDFPIHNAAQGSNGGGGDVFVTKLNASGTALVFSTYYGGTLDDAGTGIALDALGDAYVTGRTLSSNYPVSGAFQTNLIGSSDAFVTEFSNTGAVTFSSFLGGLGDENSLGGLSTNAAIGAVAVDSLSNVYLGGATNSSTQFPVKTPLGCCASFGGGLADGFIAKVGAAPADFSVAVSPTSISTTSGQTTAAITVTISPVNASYGQAVSLSCGNLPAKAVCHFSPASVTPGSSAVTSSLTIATNGASSASLAMAGENQGMRVFAALLFPVFGITLLGAGKNPRRRKLLGLLLLGWMLASLMLFPACGGSSGNGGGGQAPGTPSGLTATAGNQQVSLTWNAVTTASSYHVKRATVSGGPYTTISSPTTATYTDTSLTNGTTYYYVVSAVNANGESSNSSEVSGTPAAGGGNTTPGTYNITVVGTSGGVNHSAPLTFTVN